EDDDVEIGERLEREDGAVLGARHLPSARGAAIAHDLVRDRRRRMKPLGLLRVEEHSERRRAGRRWPDDLEGHVLGAAPDGRERERQPERAPVHAPASSARSSSVVTVDVPGLLTTSPAAALASSIACGSSHPTASARASVATTVSPAPVTSKTARARAGT